MFYFIIVIWVILDLITKNLAYLYLQEKLAIIWDFVYLQFILNPWIAFGIEINPILLKILTISLIILIFYYHRYERKNEKKKKWKKLIDISFALILAWAIWNAYERVFNSNVIDFVWVKYFSVFNLADSFITIGAILYLYILYKNN